MKQNFRKGSTVIKKKVFWGYFFTSVTPDLYNDLKVVKNLIWSDIHIDTVSEKIYISNLDPEAAVEISKHITKFMMEEKKKYGKKDNYDFIFMFFIN